MMPRNATTRGIAVAAVLVVIAALVWTTISPSSHHIDPRPTGASDTQDAVEPGNDSEATTEGVAPDESESGTDRVGITASDLRGRIHTVDGAELIGEGLVQWQVLRPASPTPDGAGWELGAPADGLSTRTLDLNYRLGPPSFSRAAGVLVGTHADAIAGAFLVDDDRSTLNLPLQSHARLAVEVVDASGTPVENATVLQMAAFPLPNGRIHQAGWTERTDEAGTCPAFPCAGTMRFQAVEGETRSGVWTGTLDDAGSRIRLVLHPTFEVAGRVLDLPEDVDPTQLEISVRTHNQQWDQALHVIPVTGEGSFEATDVPLPEATDYLFHLRGPGITAQEQVVRVSRAGQRIDLEYRCTTGLVITYLALDADRTPVPGVKVSAIWWPGHGYVRSSAVTNEEGIARIEDVPTGKVWARTSRSGFVDEAHGPWVYVSQPEVIKELHLQTAGRIEGRVLSDDGPVKDFKLEYWGDGGSPRGSKTFTARSDGKFSLDTVPLGKTHLLATSEDMAAGPHETVELASGQTAVVELTVEKAVLMTGRVLDVGTGLPIAGARLQGWTATGDSMALGTWGAQRRTDGNGRFTDLPVCPNHNVVQVDADGYGTVYEREVRPNPAGEVGPFGLSRQRPLTVRLVGRKAGDYGGFRIQIDSLGQHPMQEVSPDGVHVEEGVSAGLCVVTIIPPDSVVLRSNLMLLEGLPWDVEVPVHSSHTLTVSLIRAAGVELPDTTWVIASFDSPSGVRYEDYQKPNSNGQVEFTCGHGHYCTLDVFDDAIDESLCFRSVRLTDGATTHVDLNILGDRSRLRIVDQEGTPLVGAFIDAYVTDDPLQENMIHELDQAGECLLPDFLGQQIEIFCSHTSGIMTGRQQLDLTATNDEGVVEVKIDASASLTHRLTEDGEPRVGVRVTTNAVGSPRSIRDETSNDEGIIRSTGLTNSPYRVRVQGAGWWPTERTLVASENSPIHTLPLYRRGGLRLQVTQEGLPVPGATVELSPTGIDGSPSTWAAEGKLSLSDNQWRTNQKGELVIDGLPAVDFTWRVTSADGQVEVEGSSSVSGGERSLVPVLLP